ncbi:MAG: hypothetical protein Hyperionvirus14_18 [Hyperionvirus sp.]|uniref:Uncharacterized protein n=1 Tax=Hyperionvirus sp. TaxID=2487770 RepID=A0A3G5AEY5_9VIRU|nr:MAG: hypothetical protein Hyperionvirus14_18 [Hyperionvirus sp.]
MEPAHVAIIVLLVIILLIVAFTIGKVYNTYDLLTSRPGGNYVPSYRPNRRPIGSMGNMPPPDDTQGSYPSAPNSGNGSYMENQ